MDARSPPATISGAAAVSPRRTAWGVSTVSVSSARMAPGRADSSAPSAARKPIRLPKDMFIRPSSTPPASTAQAARTFPARQRA